MTHIWESSFPRRCDAQESSRHSLHGCCTRASGMRGKTGHRSAMQAPRPLFDPTCKPLFNGETYRDRLPYNELQPNKVGALAHVALCGAICA